MGASYEVQDIPADLVEKAEQYRAELVGAVAEANEELMENYLEEGELTIPRSSRVSVSWLSPARHSRSLWFCIQEPRCSAHAGRCDRVPALPAGRSGRCRLQPSNEEEKLTRKASADEPLRSTGVQGCSSPVLRSLTYTRVLRYRSSGPAGSELHQRVRRSVSVSSSRCTPTRRTLLRRLPQVTFTQQSV